MKAILLSTLKEMVRKKTFVVMFIVTVLYLIFWTVLLYHFNGSMINENVDGSFQALASALLFRTGLQFASMLICLLTIMLGAGTIASDLENGLVLGIVSRPIKRSSYVLGKFFGVLLLIALFGSILFFLLLLVGVVFSLSTIVSLSFMQVLTGWLFFLTVPSAVLCLTIFGSVSLKTVPNGLLMIFIYILGNIGGMVEMIGQFINDTNVISGGIFISLVSPFHTLYTTAERIMLPSSGIAGEMMRGMGGLSGSGSDPSVWMYLYIAVYAVGFVMLAVRKFGKTDINV